MKTIYRNIMSCTLKFALTLVVVGYMYGCIVKEIFK